VLHLYQSDITHNVTLRCRFYIYAYVTESVK